MDLSNSFVVPADIETAWKALQDVEGLAPCMPGATLDTHDGDDFTGSVKVKLGPVSQVYGGKDTRGGGTAQGKVRATLVAEAPDRTRVDVVTELSITGKAAQFGRGVMQDVASRIIDQFANNLATLITASVAVESAAGSVPAAAEAGGSPLATATATSTGPQPVVHHEDSIDLLGTAGAPVLKRAIPVAIGVVIVVGVIIWLARRGR